MVGDATCVIAVTTQVTETHIMATPTLEDLRIASRVPVFDGLKPEDVNRLLAPATALTLKHGECLYHQGDLATAFYIVVDGWMKLYRITTGGEVAIKIGRA